MDPDCIFCKIISKEIATAPVYEDEHVVAFLDIAPVSIGHTLVVPKGHYKNIYDIPRENLEHMISSAQKIARAQKETLGAEGVNIIMNNDTAAGQIVFHAHMHIIPRYTGDGHQHFHGRTYTNEEIAQAYEPLKKSLM